MAQQMLMENMSLAEAKLANLNIRKFRVEIGTSLLANSGSYWYRYIASSEALRLLCLM